MTDWNKLKVVDLKAELKKRGLAQAGLKPALISRLNEAEIQDGSESETTIQGDAGKHDASSAASPDTISPVLPPSGLSAEFLPDAPAPSLPEVPLQSAEIVAGENDTLDANAITTQSDTVPVKSISALPSQQKDSHGSALPLVEPEEAIEDKQKRKRRSQSPPLSAIDAARKRFRPNDNDGQAEEVITTKSDEAWVGKHNTIDIDEVNAVAEETEPAGEVVEPSRAIVDVAKEEIEAKEGPASGEGILGVSEKMEVSKSKPDLQGTTASEPGEDSPPQTRDSRFRTLFSSERSQGAAMAKLKSRDFASDAMEVEPDRVISPAIHPATAALYIRDFMRPLNPTQLKSHLASLAAPPGTDIDPDVIISFYLDPIRTHAFVSFTNTSAASRVRNALHDQIWPNERTRKPLWVDFVPLEKVEEWISQEQATNPGARSQSKKWEVYYHSDEDRSVTATLQEVVNAPRVTQPLHHSSISAPPPQLLAAPAPRSILGAPSGPRVPTAHPQRAASLAKLDELFMSTTTKPVLYFQPIDKKLADKRLDNLERAMSKDASAGRRIGGEINRYTFEDEDRLVDRGPEIFPGIRPPPGHHALRGGGPRGGFRGRGGFGGGRERGYDSYRGQMARRNSRDDRRY